MRRPLQLMRTRGLSGPLVPRSGIKGIGNAFSAGILGGVAPGPGGETDAASFNGGDIYFLRAAAMTGLSDGQIISGSFFLNPTYDTDVQTILAIANIGGALIGITILNGTLTIALTDDTGNTKSLASVIDTNIWHHITFNYSLTTGVGYMYSNNTQLAILASIGVNFDFQNATDWTFGAGAGGAGATFFKGCMSHFWLDVDNLMDMSVQANREKFHDGSFIPVSLGTQGQDPSGSQVFIYFEGSDFVNNLGFGEDFIANGTSGQCNLSIDNPNFDAAKFINANNNKLVTTTDLTGLGTFRKATFVFSLLYENGITANSTIILGGDRSNISRGAGQILDVAMRKSNFVDVIRFSSTETLNPADGWMTLMISFDVDAIGGASMAYLNDTKLTMANSTLVPDDITFTLSPSGVITIGGIDVQGCFAKVWADFGNNIDFDIEANRRKFVQADGSFEDLGANGETPTGTSPIIFHEGGIVAFKTALGTGAAALTESGTAMTDCTAQVPV